MILNVYEKIYVYFCKKLLKFISWNVSDPKTRCVNRADYCVIFRWFYLLIFYSNRRAQRGISYLEKVDFLVKCGAKI